MLKICHIAPGHRAHHMRIFHRFCWSMVKAGHQVELIAHAESDIQKDGIHIHDLGVLGQPTLRWNLWARFSRNLKAYALAVRTQADIYFFYSPEFIPFALLLQKFTGKAVVFDCMEDFIGYARQRAGIPNGLRGPLAFFVGHIFGLAAKHFDFVTVADRGTENQFLKHSVNVITIYNFPRLTLFPPPKSNHNIDCEFDLVYHGSLPRYHLALLLEIDRQLLLFGEKAHWYLFGVSPHFEWFQEELKRVHAEHRFTLGDLIPHDLVHTEVQRAKIGIIPLPPLPKFLNNIPQKLFEYMALGLPVVLSDLPPSRPFVANNNVAIMVDPNDPAAYAKAIVTLLNDPKLCKVMGRRGRQLVEQTYNWETESKKLMALIDALTVQQAKSDQAVFIADAD
jgi:glycosyltransferase involved in cell wall biosynthesis